MEEEKKPTKQYFRKKERVVVAQYFASGKAKYFFTIPETVDPAFGAVKVNPKTGEETDNIRYELIPGTTTPVYDPVRGTNKPITRTWSFDTISTSTESGVLSSFTVYNDTPKIVHEKLEELAQNPSTSVVTAEMHRRSKNPEAYDLAKRFATFGAMLNEKERTMALIRETLGEEKMRALGLE